MPCAIDGNVVINYFLICKVSLHSFRNCIGQHFAMNEEKVVLAKLLRK